MSTNSQIAFAPLGKTVVVAAAAVAPAGIQAPVTTSYDPQNSGQYRFVNSGAVTVFLGFGSSADIAKANAVAPTAGTPTYSVVLIAGAVAILRFNIATYFSGLSSAPATVYVTPGQGL